MADTNEQIIDGSGNVFADLGLADADELLVQAELVHLVHAELRRRGLKPAAAAVLLGIAKDDAAQIINGQFAHLPTDRLLHLLTLLDQDVEIVVRPRQAGQSRARLRVVSIAV
ncbi:MAG TPA: XRE family transcriptional regulator [Acetobacteraceae bacterium]|nr:XRE family transcriptional regulator [Acetobacteraceae bacterium]